MNATIKMMMTVLLCVNHVVSIHIISETIGLYTTPYYGNQSMLHVSIIISEVHKVPSSGFVMQKYIILYFWNTKPDDGCLTQP